MAHSMMTGFTCSDVLLIPDLKEAVVLAGAGGLHHQINRVNVMEVPDVIDWVRPGEFLITSGFPFRDQPDMISDMIPQLLNKGVSALGIKTKRFIDAVPKRALELADQLDFPIIELPSSTVFSDVVRDIMERVLVQEARELSQLQSRFQKLSQQLLYGEGIEEFLQALDGMLNNPVILLDDYDQVLLSPSAKELKCPGDASIWAQLREESNLGISFITLADRRIRAYVSAVNDKQYHQCLLILLEWNQELAVVDQLTIDRVGVLVGLEMINANARREVELKYVDQFLQDWISGRIAAAEDLKLRAEACGCQLPEQGLYVVLVRWLDARPEMKQLQQAVKRLRSGAGREQFKPAIIEGELTIAFSDLSHSPLAAALSFISSELNRIFGTDAFSFCIGKRVDRANHIHLSYEDAKKILHISTICNFRELHIDFKKLGVFRLLYQLPDQDEIRAYCDPYIVPLLEYESKHGSQLLETLSIYFKYNRNLKKTSAELFTHYNTVAYRVERACEIVGINSDSGDEMLQLYLAIKLYEMRAT